MLSADSFPKTGAQAITDGLRSAGVSIVATLPDAWLTSTIAEVEADPGMTLVRVAREDEGVGICAGAFLAGKRAVLLAQNAGFLLSVNALAGMALHHHIPILMLLVDRGGPDDDQFFQSYKGRVTRPVLDALGFPYHKLDRAEDAETMIAQASRQAQLARSPVAVLLSRALLTGGAA